MLVPKRVKHRKVQRGSMKGKAKGGTRLNHGEYGIQALEAAWITNRQIEAARIAMTRYMKRGGKVWITIFPDKPITKKPAETRMGSAEIRELSADDLQATLKEARAELFNLRFQMATSQLDNTARVKQVKKDIARIQTEMRARELSA